MAGVAAVATIFSAAVSYSAANKASRRADEAAAAEKEMAIQEAAAIEAETAESVRRAKDAAAKAEGTSRARAAASGLELDGSLGLSLSDMSQEHMRQIDWMAKAGASRARMAIMGGDLRSDAQSARADQFTAQSWGAISSGVSGGYTAGASAGWWS